MATVRDIAEAVGVSIGTVDRIIHNRGRFSDMTAEKVRQAMKDLNYTPNIHARGLKKSRSYVFGAVIPRRDQDAGYWQLVEDGILRASKELSSYKSEVLIFFFDRNSTESCQSALSKALDSDVEGLLLAPVLPGGIQKQLANSEIPYLFIDTEIPEMKNRISYIGQDSFQSGVLAGKLMGLLLQGKSTKQSVYLVDPPGSNYHLQSRISGFTQYSNESLPGVELKIIKEEVDDENRFHQYLDDLFSKEKDLPDGVFVANSSVYYMASYFAKKGGAFVKIPLIGYDLVPNRESLIENEVIDFILTQQPEEQGYKGVLMLYDAIVLNKPIQKEIIVPLNIVTKENLHTFVNKK